MPQVRRQAQAVRQLAIKAIAAPAQTDIKHALRNVKPQVGTGALFFQLGLGFFNILFQLPVLLQLLINGKFVDASSGKTFATENPATKEELIQVAEGSAEDVEAAIDAARAVSPAAALFLGQCLAFLYACSSKFRHEDFRRPSTRVLGHACQGAREARSSSSLQI